MKLEKHISKKGFYQQPLSHKFPYMNNDKVLCRFNPWQWIKWPPLKIFSGYATARKNSIQLKADPIEVDA